MKYAIGLLILLMLTNDKIIYNAATSDNFSDWYVVNDGVMGGLSEGKFYINDSDIGVFEGTIRLENYGGFSSIRMGVGNKDVSDYSKLKLRLKGDGKRYQVRVKSSRRDYQSYIGYIQTNSDWQIYEIDLAEMYPTFRGRRLRMPDYPKEVMAEMSILIGNKKAEDFRLLIDSIWIE